MLIGTVNPSRVTSNIITAPFTPTLLGLMCCPRLATVAKRSDARDLAWILFQTGEVLFCHERSAATAKCHLASKIHEKKYWQQTLLWLLSPHKGSIDLFRKKRPRTDITPTLNSVVGGRIPQNANPKRQKNDNQLAAVSELNEDLYTRRSVNASTLNSAEAANSLVATVAWQPCQPLSHNQLGSASRAWPTGQHEQEKRA